MSCKDRNKDERGEGNDRRYDVKIEKKKMVCGPHRRAVINDIEPRSSCLSLVPTPTGVSVLPLILQTKNERGGRLTHTFITVTHFHSLSCSSSPPSDAVVVRLRPPALLSERCWVTATFSGPSEHGSNL